MSIVGIDLMAAVDRAERVTLFAEIVCIRRHELQSSGNAVFTSCSVSLAARYPSC